MTGAEIIERAREAPSPEARAAAIEASKRVAHARALWRDAKTPELPAHLRLIYPGLFANAPEPPPRRERAIPHGPDYPEGFHNWPLGKRNGWYAEFTRGRLERERD